MINGTGDCACNQGAANTRQMFAVIDCLGESCKEVGASLWEDFIEELIVVVLNLLEELLPALPHAIVLGVCTSNCCVFAGSCCSSAVSQETVAGGRELIQNFFRSWLGSEVVVP